MNRMPWKFNVKAEVKQQKIAVEEERFRFELAEKKVWGNIFSIGEREERSPEIYASENFISLGRIGKFGSSEGTQREKRGKLNS